MGKIIGCTLEDCLFNIHIESRRFTKVLRPNDTVINLVKSYLDNGYSLSIVSNFCSGYYENLNTLNSYGFNSEQVTYLCENHKMKFIVEKLKPEIYIDNHLESCAALLHYNIKTYFFSNINFVNNSKTKNRVEII